MGWQFIDFIQYKAIWEDTSLFFHVYSWEEYASFRTFETFPLQLLGSHLVTSCLWAVLPDVPRHWRVSPASGGRPHPRLLPSSGGVARRLRRKGKFRRGLRHFWNCLTRVGSGPATGPTLNGLVPHSYAGGA